jgi:D-psicose/D-tagatose/L-ribulose 3-epimerase
VIHDALRLSDDIGQAAINYNGPITFESFSSAVVARGLSNDLAVHAREFMANLLLASRAAR